ncbi:hypothetical protein C8R46DRAFT_1082986 [Mycena filopes]|nr:hypothetical protein C8R46DRAFT_1082986 [Mycena filopes]
MPPLPKATEQKGNAAWFALLIVLVRSLVAAAWRAAETGPDGSVKVTFKDVLPKSELKKPRSSSSPASKKPRETRWLKAAASRSRRPSSGAMSRSARAGAASRVTGTATAAVTAARTARMAENFMMMVQKVGWGRRKNANARKERETQMQWAVFNTV